MEHLKTVVNARIADVTQVKNVFYFRNTNILFPPADLIVAKFYEPIQEDLHSTFVIDDVTTYVWEGDEDGVWWDAVNNKPKEKAPWGVGYPSSLSESFVGGMVGNEILPMQMAPCIYAKTNRKHVIARKFFAGYTEAYGAGGVMIAAVKGRLQEVATGWLQEFANGSTSWYPEVWGPHYGFNVLESSAISPYLGTQRRRKPGVGV